MINLLSKFVASSFILTLSLITLSALSTSEPLIEPANAGGGPTFPDTVKEIGYMNESGDFVPSNEFIVGQEAVVKLTVYGVDQEETNPVDQDIMLIMDRSGSMAWRWNGRFDEDPNSPFKMDVAKEALDNFVNAADPAYHNIGLSSYRNHLLVSNIRYTDTSPSDATETLSTGAVDLTNGTLEFSDDTLVGLHFSNVTIPSGTNMNLSRINLRPDDLNLAGRPTTFTFSAEASANASTFTSTNSDLSSRPRLSTTIQDNNVAIWNTPEVIYNSPDLAPLIEAVVNQPGWTPGGAINIFVETTGYRAADAYDSDNSTTRSPRAFLRENVTLEYVATIDMELTNDYPLLADQIDGLVAQGATSIGGGLAVGIVNLLEQAREGSEKVIVLATDGQHNTWPAVFDEFDDGSYNFRTNDTMPSDLSDLFTVQNNSILEAAMNNNIKIYTVGIGVESLGGTNLDGGPWTCPLDGSSVNTGREYMECVAYSTGGEYYYAPTPDDLVQIYGEIAHQQLDWEVTFEDFLVEQHFQDLTIIDVTDLDGNHVDDDVIVVNNDNSSFSGNLGVLHAGEGRVIYLSTTITEGDAINTSWTTTVDALPDANNTVTYTNPVDSTEVITTIINVNPTITVRVPQPATISGTVYNDEDYSCSQGGSETGFSAADITLEQLLPPEPGCSYNRTIQPVADGTFSFNNLGCFEVARNGDTSATYRLTFNSTDPLYTERCGNIFNITVSENENYSTDLAASLVRDAWIQARNGGIYANGNITSLIPNTATNSYLILSDPSPSMSDGIAVANTLALGAGTVSSSGWTATPSSVLTPDTSYASIRETVIDYADNTSYSGNPPVLADADSNSSEGVAIYYSAADVTLSGDWQNIDYPVVVISDSNVIIPDSIVDGKISLGPAGFLLIAAQNDIIISDNIGTTDNDSEVPQLEGLFVAGRNFNAGGTGNNLVDRRLNVYGTVVVGTDTNGSYLSNRTHEENYLYASDYFEFNPKLILNIPDLLSDPIFSWKEVR